MISHDRQDHEKWDGTQRGTCLHDSLCGVYCRPGATIFRPIPTGHSKMRGLGYFSNKGENCVRIWDLRQESWMHIHVCMPYCTCKSLVTWWTYLMTVPCYHYLDAKYRCVERDHETPPTEFQCFIGHIWKNLSDLKHLVKWLSSSGNTSNQLLDSHKKSYRALSRPFPWTPNIMLLQISKTIDIFRFSHETSSGASSMARCRCPSLSSWSLVAVWVRRSQAPAAIFGGGLGWYGTSDIHLWLGKAM